MDALLDRELLFGNPDRAQARLSPDGAWLSFLAPRDGVLNVWVAPVDDLGAARAVTSDTGRGIQSHTWAESSERLLYVQDTDGDENWRLYAVDPRTLETLDLTPLQGVQTQVIGTSPRHPHLVLIGLNDRDPQLHDPHLVDIRTGERRRLLENPGFVGFDCDWDLDVRLALQMLPTGGLAVLERQGEGWAPLFEIPPEDALSTRPQGCNAAGTVRYWVDSRGRETAALVAEDRLTGERRVLAEDPRADVTAWAEHPETGEIEVAWITYDERHAVVLDERIRSHLERLEPARPGTLEIVSRSRDDRRWVVAWQPEDGPILYGLYDTSTGEIRDLFHTRTALVGLPLARRRPMIVRSRDGFDLVSYLSLPRWLDRGGRPEQPLPMVLLVHGGPWWRDQPGYDPTHQLLANRGYAVLSVNFRGSTGLGKRLLNAGNFEWGAKMHDDLLDAVDQAVEQGIARRDAVAIMGGSYGGYATLVGLTFTPDVFACGVDIVGPSSLITLLESVPPYWAPLKAQFHSRVGDDTTDEGRAFLWSRSPLSRVDAIRRPLLIAQGANDPRVKQAESDQIVAAMQAHGIPVRYALFPDEGHGFARPENQLAFMAEVERFLAEHLGGRAQPDDGAAARSSMRAS